MFAPESGTVFGKRLRSLFLHWLAFASLLGSARAGTWNVVFSDDFHRPDSPILGNTWKDTEKVASISNQTLRLTPPVGTAGSDLRVSRPAVEYGLEQRIEASFIMPATNDGLAHSAYVRGKSLFVAGQRLDPAIMVNVQHRGNLSVVFGYRGGGRVFPYLTGSGVFVSVPGHAYTLAVQITNNFPAALSATLTDDTTSAVVASVSFNDAAQYTYPTTHLSPDFKTAGVVGLSMDGPWGSSVSFTKVTTYRWKESGTLTAQFAAAYTQHGGKTWLASPFPSGGSGSYKIRWYRGTFGFVPPVTKDGSGPGTGTYLGNTWEIVDSDPPAGVTNFSIYYRAVYFDTGANASTGILGQYRNTNSPPPQKNAAPLWIGDSITFGYATSANWYTKSPAAYAHTFLTSNSTLTANYSIFPTGYNNVMGVNGRTSTDAVAGLPKIIGQARITGATFANIMLGTNDSKNSVSTSPAQYKSNISALVSALKEQNPDIRIVLNKPLWFQPDTGYGSDFSTASLGRIAQYHSMLDQMADGKSIVVGGAAASDELQAHGWQGTIGQTNPSNATTAYPPAPTGTQSYLNDGLHPFDGGAEMIAKLEWGPNAMAALLGNYTPIPTVDAGACQIITFPAASTTLSGSATNPNGPITDYLWTKISGVPSTIESPTSAMTGVTGLTEGTHVFRLTATNSRGATGFGEITVVVRQAATYASWAALNGLSGSAALPDADPDGNGTINLVEYATGIQHGALPNVGLPTPQRSGDTLSLTYRTVQTDVTYIPEWSDDLIAWSATDITITTNGVYETASLPIAAGRQGFMRLRIEQN